MDNYETLIDEGQKAFLNGACDRAIKIFDQAKTTDPQKMKAYLWMGRTYRKVGDFENALYEYNKAIRVAPEEAAPYLGIATIYAELNDPRCQEVMATAAERTIDSPEHQMILGFLANTKKDFHQALKHLLKASEWFPDDPDLLATIGNLYLQLNQDSEAQWILSRATTSPDSQPKYFYWLGIAEERLGNMRAAMSAYETAFNAEPNFYDALRALAKLEFRMGHLGAWMRHLRQALRITMAQQTVSSTTGSKLKADAKSRR